MPVDGVWLEFNGAFCEKAQSLARVTLYLMTAQFFFNLLGCYNNLKCNSMKEIPCEFFR